VAAVPTPYIALLLGFTAPRPPHTCPLVVQRDADPLLRSPCGTTQIRENLIVTPPCAAREDVRISILEKYMF